MTKGPAGYGRYTDAPEHVGCPRARSDMTPCIARDGSTALSSGGHGHLPVCVGCAQTPANLIFELAAACRQPPWDTRMRCAPARHAVARGDPEAAANRLTWLVRQATEPAEVT